MASSQPVGPAGALRGHQGPGWSGSPANRPSSLALIQSCQLQGAITQALDRGHCPAPPLPCWSHDPACRPPAHQGLVNKMEAERGGVAGMNNTPPASGDRHGLRLLQGCRQQGRGSAAPTSTQSSPEPPTRMAKQWVRGPWFQAPSTSEGGAPSCGPRQDSPQSLCIQAALLAVAWLFSGIRPDLGRTQSSSLLAPRPTPRGKPLR